MNSRTERAWPWLVDIPVILYVTWICHALSVRVPPFRDTFSALGTQLPATTLLVIRLCTARNLYTLATVIALALIVKNLLMKSPIAKLSISLIAILLVFWSSGFVTEAVMRPMVDLMNQIGK